MQKHLLLKMSSDMHIQPFIGEEEENFICRLIFSSFAAWAKELINGRSFSECIEDGEAYTDILHIQYRLRKVIKAMCSIIPLKKDWMKQLDDEIFATNMSEYILRELVEYPYCMAEVDERKRVYSPSALFSFDNYYLLRGCAPMMSDFVSVGLCQWTAKKEEYEIIVSKMPHDSEMYYQSLINDADWREANLKGQYKIYCPGQNPVYKEGWRNYQSNKILSEGISLLRSVENGCYLLLKKIDGIDYIAILDPWYSTTGEIFRICYAIDKISMMQKEFLAIIYRDYIIIKCYNKLPKLETKVILSASWPLKTFEDERERVVPRFLWNIVKKQIENLGIKITEREGG